eukprot:CAMPEP_0119349222 /NCGR_PEP_ID=MMETSP1333-20130426/109442_1 /TAXON_ID=418940 /ORGANISM="Scyphosphaera apsteinii, Strain RCC1455" /LENGTH=49 /DNA_ID= /DNA_START= /DNA_END= /DNA_ORIENTATION=
MMRALAAAWAMPATDDVALEIEPRNKKRCGHSGMSTEMRSASVSQHVDW